MSSYRFTPDKDQYYRSPARRTGGYQHQNLIDTTHHQQPSTGQPNAYCPRPREAIHQQFPFPSLSGHPMDASRQGYENYYSQNTTHPYQTHSHPPVTPRQPSSNVTGYYYTQTSMPERPPPAYEYLYGNGEGSAEQSESINFEEIHQAEEFVDRQTLGWIPSRKPGRNQYMARLEKPVVIPRIGVTGRLKSPLPFLRAYSPILVVHDVNEVEFLAFIDNIGVAQAGSPIFSAVNVASQVMGLVPNHWVALAATGLQVASGMASAALSKVRTQRFLANRNRVHDHRPSSSDSFESNSSESETGDRYKYQKKYEKKLAKANRKADRANEKDEKTAKRMEYVVVENL